MNGDPTMRNVKGGGRNRRPRSLFALLVAVVAVGSPVFAADRFDDISIQPQVFFQGDTHHGYVEHRVLVENHSPDRSRTVGIEMPNQSHNYGTRLQRLSRSVTVGPNSALTISLWQPPVPIYGNNLMTVSVDGRRRGTVTLPAGLRHRAGFAGSGGVHAGTFLVSRSLNSDDLDKLLKGESATSAPLRTGPYSAHMATGHPNAGRGAGMAPNAWSPELSGGTGAEWFEADFSPARAATRVRLYTRSQPPNVATMVLLDASKAELARFTGTNMPPVMNMTYGGYPAWEFGPFTNTNAIATVRVEFTPGISPMSLTLDAVELHDGRAGVFATGARASSTYNVRYGGGRSASPAELSPTVLRAEMEANAWRDHWLAFTPFEAILVMRADFMAMPPVTQAALWNWVNAGGSLVVFGDIPIPAPWNANVSHPHPGSSDARSGTRLFHVGFGQCVLFASAATASLSPLQVRFLRDLGRSSGSAWPQTADMNAANAAFPVIADLQIPVRGLVAIMLLFILVVGPLNLFVLARTNRRIWALWTIPAISAVTCLLVFGWSLLSEGITPHARIEGVTLLDQHSHRATTLGATAFYAPLTPGDGLRFSYDTEATPVGFAGELRGYGPRQDGSPVEVELTQVQHFRRGWVTARVPAHFQLRKSETRRERVQLERTGGNLAVVNGLGANIETLWFADTNGVIRKAQNIVAGQKVALEPPDLNHRVTAPATGLHEFFKSATWDATRPPMVSDSPSCLRPNTYIAILADAPFLENALGGKTAVRTRSLVYGVLSPEDVK